MALSEESPAKRRRIEECQDLDVIKFSPVKSLRLMSGVNLCLNIGVAEDAIRGFCTEFDHTDKLAFERLAESLWHIEEESVKEKFQKLGIPECLWSFLFLIIIHVVEEVYSWMLSLRYLPLFNNTKYVVWSNSSIIKSCATIGNILSISTMPASYKYKFACLFCLKDDIVTLEPEVLTRSYLRSVDINTHPMVHFWSFELFGKRTVLNRMLKNRNKRYKSNWSVNEFVLQKLLEDSFNQYNRTAIWFMWNKLTAAEKENCLVHVLTKDTPMDFKYYAMSQVDLDHQLLGLSSAALPVLEQAIQRYCYDANFLPLTNLILKCVTGETFSVVLKTIIGKAYDLSQVANISDNPYIHMFRRLWLSASELLKENVLDTTICDSSHLCCGLTMVDWSEYFDLVDLVLRYGNAGQRKRMYFSSCCLDKCGDLLLDDQWDLFEEFTSLCVISNENLHDFKNRLIDERFVVSIANKFAKERRWSDLDRFLEWVFASVEEKRNMRLKVANIYFDFWVEECLRMNAEFVFPEDDIKMCLKNQDAWDEVSHYFLQKSNEYIFE